MMEKRGHVWVLGRSGYIEHCHMGRGGLHGLQGTGVCGLSASPGELLLVRYPSPWLCHAPHSETVTL